MALCRRTLGGECRWDAANCVTRYTRDLKVAVDGIDGRRRANREEGEEPMSKHQIQPGRASLARPNKFSGPNGEERESMSFPVELTASRIDNHVV